MILMLFAYKLSHSDYRHLDSSTRGYRYLRTHSAPVLLDHEKHTMTNAVMEAVPKLQYTPIHGRFLKEILVFLRYR